jgi:cytochrome oxidase Cu insertion factor (SCO1/SenC/PrrC family)
MDNPRKSLQWTVWGALTATILGVVISFVWSRVAADQNIDLPVISQIPAFSLTNQDFRTFTKLSLLGRVTLADIVFTRCGGPCPEMTRKMSELQTALPADRAIQFLTLTTDPGFDTPEVLKRFGARFNADFNRWSFVTGPKIEIARLAVDGLKLVAEEKPAPTRTSAEDLFIHSTIFVVVDKQGQLRGSFDSSEPDFQKRVRAAVKKLLKEKGA